MFMTSLVSFSCRTAGDRLTGKGRVKDVVVFEGVVVGLQIEINVGHDIEISGAIKVWGKAASVSQRIVSSGE